jgi:hypothetical protein
MEPENEVIEPQVDQETTPEEVEVPVDEPSESVEDLRVRLEEADKARRQLTARATKAEADKKALEAKLKANPTAKASLDVEDYIDISASLEGLDQREKEYLAELHKLSGRPLSEIRKNEDFGLWQSAYRQKVEKEKGLAPSSTQTDSDRPKSLTERLANASLDEKEKILAEAGLWKSPRPKADRANIGNPRVI